MARPPSDAPLLVILLTLDAPEPTTVPNAGSPTRHHRIARECRAAILEGGIPPGSRFPSERELAERYRVSRATANKVISTLVTEGLLELQKGLGSRVKPRKRLFASLDGMESFTQHVSEQGMRPSTRVLRFEPLPPQATAPVVRRGLELKAGAPETVLYLERLRCADDVPMILEQRWVREALAPGLRREQVADSFYRVLEEDLGLLMTGESHSISAVILDPSKARLLGLDEPTAALVVEGTGFVRDREPLWYQRLYYRGDRYQLHNETRGPAYSGIALQLQP